MKEKKLDTIPLGKIKIADPFWDRYSGLVKDVLLPYQWDILNDRLEDAETSHCIKNFKIAAGEEDGDFEGAVFQDTDVAKWLEAVAYSLETSPDQELEELADKTINLIGKAQCEDGYLNTYFTIRDPARRWTNLREGHELYTAGHMIEAAVAYYEATGKKKFLDIAQRFADLICSVFGYEEGKCHGYPGHQEIELALVRLYEATGKKAYLKTAKYFIDSRGRGENYFLKEMEKPGYQQIFPEFCEYDVSYSQSHLPVREQRTAEGHAVRAVYMYCAMADLAYLYKDEELFGACEALWKDMTGRRMYLTGGIGSSGILERFTTDYDLPNDRNYSETCASIGLALFGRRMAQITGDASYMDEAERALYNTVLSGIAMDGRSFFYVNPLEVWPGNCMAHTSMEHVKPVRQRWFGVACCPPNIARTLASLGQYLYFTSEDTLYVNLYVSGTVETRLCKAAVKLAVESDLTNTGKIRLMFEAKEERTGMNLALRIPSYVQKYTVSGEEGTGLETQILAGCPVEKGYLYIRGLPKGRSVIDLEFSVPARFVRANPMVRADAGKVALVKGPLVYCLEEADNGENLSAVFADAKGKLVETYEKDLLGGVTTVTFTGKRLRDSQWKDGALYADRENTLEEVALKAVPYYCWGNREPGEMQVWIKELIS